MASVLISGFCFISGNARAQNATAGAAVFQSQCGICHSIQSGQNKIGPSLFGLVGRKAGQVPGFRYSDANRSSGDTWDAATLDRYLMDPRAFMPHTTMTYAGLKDPGKRRNLIAYLSTIR